MERDQLPLGTEHREFLLTTLILGRDHGVAEWVARQLDGFDHAEDFGLGSAIGIAKDGVLICGVVYNNFHKGRHGNTVGMTIFASSPKWINRGTLRALFHYPFVQLGCVRVTALTAKRNKRARRFLEGLGFQLEGVSRKAFDGRMDAMIYGLLRDECKWLDSGQVVSLGTSSTRSGSNGERPVGLERRNSAPASSP